MKLSYFKSIGFFELTLLISAILHLFVIIAVKFDPPQLKFLKDKMPALEVVLVNTKTKSKPVKADALAQANLNRGGNTDADRQMKSALPPPKELPNEQILKPELEAKLLSKQEAETEALAKKKQQNVAKLERETQLLMTQLNAIPKVENKVAQVTDTVKPENGNQEATAKLKNAADLMESSLEIAKLEAQIAKDQDEYQKRPKRKSIGARTQEYRFAAYVEAWRQKVEKIGNLNYPEAAKDQKLYGQLQLTVYIKSDGSLEKIEVRKSSGFKVLDDAAKNIVEMAAPYAPFPDDLKKDIDILDITRTWTFTKEDSFATKATD